MLAAALVAVCLIFSINVNIRYSSSIRSDLYHTVASESAKMETWFTKHVVIAEDFAKTAVMYDLHGDSLQKHMLDIVHTASDSIMLVSRLFLFISFPFSVPERVCKYTSLKCKRQQNTPI